MRLIYFTPLLSTKGGQERTLTDKANYLVGRGHQVMFVTYEHEGPLAYQLAEGVKHQDLHCHMFSLYRYPLWRRVTEALRLKRRLRHELQAVVGQFSPDVIVVPVPNTENFLSDVMKVAAGVPVVVESHLAKGHSVIVRGATEKWLYRIYRPEKAIRRAALLIALTQGDAGLWKLAGTGRVEVLPNPVTCYPDRLPDVPKQQGRIIAVGRLTPQKRFDRLIDAFALIADSHPDWHVDIFGDGEDRAKLTLQIAERGMQGRINLHHTTNNIYSEYLTSQFAVLSSDFEGFGLVVVEAMACALPVVACNCPFGPADIISSGTTGLLSRLDVADLARQMEWMMTHPAERQAMGRQAREEVRRYAPRSVLPRWEQAYLSVVRTKQQ